MQETLGWGSRRFKEGFQTLVIEQRCLNEEIRGLYAENKLYGVFG